MLLDRCTFQDADNTESTVGYKKALEHLIHEISNVACSGEVLRRGCTFRGRNHAEANQRTFDWLNHYPI